MKILTRRDFLKKSGLVAAALGVPSTFPLLSSRAATVGTESKETAPVIYPPLKGNKVQPPKNGCLVGFRKVHAEEPQGYRERLTGLTKDVKDIDGLERVLKEMKYKALLIGVQCLQ